MDICDPRVRAFWDKLRAGEISPEFLPQLEERGWGEGNALFQYAKAKSDYADFLQQTDKQVESSGHRNKVVQLLSEFFDKYEKSSSSQPAACTTVGNAVHVMNYSDLDTLLNTITAKTAPGHELVNYLDFLGMELSMDNTGRATANLMFDTVIELEETWFTEEYQQHENYAWALLKKSQNCIYMGNLADARQAMDILAKLDITNETLLKKWDYVRGYYEQTFNVSIRDIDTDLDIGRAIDTQSVKAPEVVVEPLKDAPRDEIAVPSGISPVVNGVTEEISTQVLYVRMGKRIETIE